MIFLFRRMNILFEKKNRKRKVVGDHCRNKKRKEKEKGGRGRP